MVLFAAVSCDANEKSSTGHGDDDLKQHAKFQFALSDLSGTKTKRLDCRNDFIDGRAPCISVVIAITHNKSI